MIKWRKQQKDANGRYAYNFLGVPYDQGYVSSAAAANREYVITLIKNDVEFADAYIVLGDILMDEKNYQLALRAYRRAEDLGHLKAGDRLTRVSSAWEKKVRKGYVLEGDMGWQQTRMEFTAAADWLASYQELEAERLVEGQDVSFAAMKVAMTQRAMQKPRIIEAAFYRGRENGDSRNFSLRDVPYLLWRYWYIVAIGLLGLMLVVLALTRRRRRSLKDIIADEQPPIHFPNSANP